ncbi:hypothetical protein M422DRAFT_784706 [Sphaerobolus stellatus SS14]|uniref:Uncharacterized protein n=1 Tax=Sphaerobolus stellatus (strain SS14) TaxID=990650 RepID=A0A0C9URU4_SPHS4|nr:hypothetical protein M422DRAFT_784706 [Sphaerobolus stellatus SS14]
MTSNERQVIFEEDDAGKICRRYYLEGDKLHMIPEEDIVSERPTWIGRTISTLSDIFMPAGYPTTVSADYFE